MSVIPLLAAVGHDLPGRARPQDDLRRLPGRPRPRRRRQALPLRGSGPPRRAAARRARPHAAGLHGRRQQHDRQRAGPAARSPPCAREPRRAALRRRRARLRRHRRALPRRDLRPTARAATASCATSARPTTTSSSSAASPRPTPRCWPSSPARPRSRTCSRSPRRRTSTPARRRSPRWPPCSPASTSTSAAATQLRRVLCRLTDRVLDCLERLDVDTPNRSGFPIIEIPLRDHRRIADVGRFLFDRGVYVTLAAFPLVPKTEVGFRVQLTAANTDAEIDTLIEAIEELAARGELAALRRPPSAIDGPRDDARRDRPLRDRSSGRSTSAVGCCCARSTSACRRSPAAARS